jgi:hypothetical protein
MLSSFLIKLWYVGLGRKQEIMLACEFPEPKGQSRPAEYSNQILGDSTLRIGFLKFSNFLLFFTKPIVLSSSPELNSNAGRDKAVSTLHAPHGEQLSSESGTYKTVKARFWPELSNEKSLQRFKCFPLRSEAARAISRHPHHSSNL